MRQLRIAAAPARASADRRSVISAKVPLIFGQRAAIVASARARQRIQRDFAVVRPPRCGISQSAVPLSAAAARMVSTALLAVVRMHGFHDGGREMISPGQVPGCVRRDPSA